MVGQGFEFFIDNQCVAGEPWTLLMRNVSDVHSLTVEFNGQTGGIYRYFPRQRHEMKVQFIHTVPGQAAITVIVRDAILNSHDVLTAFFDIQEARAASTAEMGRQGAQRLVSSENLAHVRQSAPVLAATNKPPLALTYNAASPSPAVLSLSKPTADRDPAQLLQDRLHQRLLNRLDRG